MQATKEQTSPGNLATVLRESKAERAAQLVAKKAKRAQNAVKTAGRVERKKRQDGEPAIAESADVEAQSMGSPDSAQQANRPETLQKRWERRQQRQSKSP